jgi:predicted nucleic acid-binding protein
VEIRSAIARLDRSGKLPPAAKVNAFEALQSLSDRWNEISPSEELRLRAGRLVHAYPLRAADALQLAAALVWCRERPKGRTFLCADDRLSDAAERAGFAVLRP